VACARYVFRIGRQADRAGTGQGLLTAGKAQERRLSERKWVTIVAVRAWTLSESFLDRDS